MIDVKKSDGRVFTGRWPRTVIDASGTIAILRGSNVELIVNKASNKELEVDLESITDVPVGTAARNGIGG